uniref:Uncharacterized protein n=1 Tax=Quercus lobata TaxID=97700 RepID=A0A7N2LBM4_QUELO
MMIMGKWNQYLTLYLASLFFFVSLSESTSSTSSEHLCLPDQSSALLQLTQEFVQKRMYSEYDDYYNGSYPKMKSWKADSDCCSCSLFSLRHLRKLNLALNNFSSSTIPPKFGQLVRSIVNLTKLQMLHLSSINQKGKVDLNIFLELKELHELNFSDFLEAQNELRILDLSNNNIKGHVLLNQNEVKFEAKMISFNVIIFEPTPMNPIYKVYELIHSSNAMLGIRGAALTHTIFLRPGPVFMQEVLLGTEWAVEIHYARLARNVGSEDSIRGALELARWGIVLIVYSLCPEKAE